ncbi:hypothetical protein P280DRAFT_321059 [Massarina eburnea CBS 473.64]|uniref:Transmembrane protein n=1 Tax=Massarina eburnea CBS 473.64 TaxID=1395130 RepID=A0A6A6S2Q5_9PLEO|nr:hypothetical protein P280DRAFT_321059 [Massarina eburnea CBS 473.64]
MNPVLGLTVDYFPLLSARWPCLCMVVVMVRRWWYWNLYGVGWGGCGVCGVEFACVMLGLYGTWVKMMRRMGDGRWEMGLRILGRLGSARYRWLAGLRRILVRDRIRVKIRVLERREALPWGNVGSASMIMVAFLGLGIYHVCWYGWCWW